MVIKDDGEVGIGTNTPSAKLEIAGTTDNQLRINKTGTEWNYIEFLQAGIRRNWLGTTNTGDFAIGSDNGASNFYFQ